MADSPVMEGQILAGKYRVEKVLGSGGMGVVVAAWHLELEQRVAVKFLHPVAMERADTSERFRREARAAAKIRSEHVARVIDVGVMEGGLPYMVMEYLDGHDIAEEMERVGALPISSAIDFVLQASEAIAEAHSVGIVHRDLKPANLFLALRPDGTRIVKVLDFGISKSLFSTSVSELSLTRTATLIGSPLYMSPEQMRSAKDVDTRTDIWSIGVMLYEMLTGRPPYTGDSIPALCASLLSDTPVSMQQLRAEISPTLESAVMRCLAKDREQRFATVSELGHALAPFGSSASQVHVDRASRLQGSTDVTLSAFSTGPMTARNTSPGPLSGLAVTPIQGSSTQTDPPARGTVNSWGRTDGPGRPARSRIFVGLGLGFICLLGLGSFLILRHPSAGTTVSSASAQAGPVAATTPAAGPSTGGPAIDVRPELASPTASPPPAPFVDAAPSAAPKASVVVRPKTPRAAPRPRELGEFSNFGGRR